MAPIQSTTKSATLKSAPRPVDRVAKPTALTAICLSGLLALIASILVLAAAPASAQPTAGTRTSAASTLNIRVAAPSSDAAPALQFTFTTNNRSRCPAGVTRWIYADSSMLTWSLATNYDPTPAVVSAPNSDQVDCSYTVAITSNLDSCTFSIDRGTGSSSTNTTFSLAGTDSPNYANGQGTFADIGNDKTVTITPSGCTAPVASQVQRLVQIRNLESQERYRLKFTPFGSCATQNDPGDTVDKSSWHYVVLDFACNWQMSATPLDNIRLGGCRVDAILYFASGGQSLVRGADLFLHASGNFAGASNNRLSRIDLLASTSASGNEACEELFRLTLRVDLPSSIRASFHKDEKVGFTIEPLSSSEHQQCTQRTRVMASHSSPTAINIVKSPAGVTSTCSYTVTADSSSNALRLSPGHAASRSFNTGGATQVTISYLYAANRLPVSVAVQIFSEPGSVFSTNDRITLLVTAPGECGSDTTMFGGVPGFRGVSYGVFVAPGVSGVIGPGANTINPAASYDLPPYLLVNGVQTPCVLRATQASAYSGCTMRNARRDSAGQPYQEVSWTASRTAFNLTLQYDCTGATPPGGSEQTTLPQGWVMLSFNGSTGTSPDSFRRSLDNAFTSLWVWNTGTQSWRGGTEASSSVTSLNKGDVVFVYVPRARTLRYSPAALLRPVASGGRTAVVAGYSLLDYAGTTSTSLSSLIGDQADSIRVIYRWNSDLQSWSYYIPGGRRVVTSARWFDTINPGDKVFVGSQSAATIRWP